MAPDEMTPTERTAEAPAPQAPPAPVLSPVAATERIQALDVLRGFAVLGILVMNIRGYAMPSAAYFFPVVHGDLEGVNFWAWYLGDLFFNFKFISIFTMLFGAGVVLMHERAAARGRGWAGLHYRRMGALWLIGMVHAYLLWEGDILVPYAVCGLLLYLFRKVRARRLLATSLVLLVIGSGLMFVAGLSAPYWGEEQLAEFNDEWQPSDEKLDEELAAMRGSWWSEISRRAPNVLEMHLFILPFFMSWRVAGMMLLGMALFKWGWLRGTASARLYAMLIVFGVMVGLPLTALGIYRQMVSDWDPVYSFFLASQFGYWGSIPMALGYVGGVMLLLRANVWQSLTTRLAAVGRMAFTNYLVQTIICTTLFYGRGLGLFGSVERVGQAGIVVLVFILQLVYSPLWLRRYRFGPAEWLWRSLSYGRRQPMRREP
jgi:uncharacterized protein